ncbi:MAG: hypothetical protein JSW39_24605, partial [Desulfobacterales bacterium]
WYVSPALFPLFIGIVIAVLGAILLKTALKVVSRHELDLTRRWLLSRNLVQYLTSEAVLRFYAITVLFLSLVYLTIPRIDFFLSSILFLTVFITMFYFDEAVLLQKLFFFYLAGVAGLLVFFGTGLDAALGRIMPYGGDVLALGFILGYCVYAWMLVRRRPALRQKYRTSLIVAIAAPMVVAPIFKYFLLVPLPTEGLIVAVLDYIRYL